MHFESALQSFGLIQQQFGPVLDTALLVFSRLVAFTVTAPIFNRKNLPIIIKVMMAMFLTGVLLWMVPVESHGSFYKGQHGLFLAQILVNVTIGAVLGFIANMILLTIASAGSVINNQIGFSSAMMMDPSTGTQAPLLEPLFTMIGSIIFIQLGGIHWMIMALKRSFQEFPLYSINQPLTSVINLDYLVQLSGDTVEVAVQMVAPIMVVTIAVDIILGVVNRAAQQMPVFQLSHALKPAVGIAILLMTLPILINAMTQYISDHASIF